LVPVRIQRLFCGIEKYDAKAILADVRVGRECVREIVRGKDVEVATLNESRQR
jgi:hypothetical protein